MADVISVGVVLKMAHAMRPEQRSALEALRSCRQCGAESTWGIVAERVAYCEDHAPWVDRDLAAQVLTGTPPGVGFARDPPAFLSEGDVVAVEIDGVGRLENRVIAEGIPGR